MEVSEAKRLKTREDEYTRLKRLLADAMLDNAALKDLSGDARGQAESSRKPASPLGCGRSDWIAPALPARVVNTVRVRLSAG
jgi:hypothetical protein